MTLLTRHLPLSRLASVSPLLVGLCLPGLAACYGSDLEGQAPEVTTAPDSEDTTDTRDSAEVGDGTAETTDASDVSETRDTADTSGPPPVWETVPLGDMGDIGDIMAVRADLAFAVSGTRVLRWNGATWAAYGEPGGDSCAARRVGRGARRRRRG